MNELLHVAGLFLYILFLLSEACAVVYFKEKKDYVAVASVMVFSVSAIILLAELFV